MFSKDGFHHSYNTDVCSSLCFPNKFALICYLMLLKTRCVVMTGSLQLGLLGGTLILRLYLTITTAQAPNNVIGNTGMFWLQFSEVEIRCRSFFTVYGLNPNNVLSCGKKNYKNVAETPKNKKRTIK